MSQQIMMLSPNSIHPHPRNEEFFDDVRGEEFERFKQSISEDGIITPLKVTRDMTIISGHQRWRAANELGLVTIPVVIDDSDMDDDDVLRQLIAANFGRMKNDPMKQSVWMSEYERLRGVGGRGGDRKSNQKIFGLIVTQDDIAKELGVTTQTVRNIKRLSTLTPELQEAITSGIITASAGFQLIAQLSEEEQQRLVELMPVGQKLVRKEVQAYIAQVKQEREEQAKVNQDLEFDNARLEAEAREAERQRDEAQAEVKRLEVALQNAELANDNDEYMRLIDKLDEAEKKYRSEYERSHRINDELNELKRKLTLAVVENDTLKREIEAIKSAEPTVREIEVEVHPEGYDEAMHELEQLRDVRDTQAMQHFDNVVIGIVAPLKAVLDDVEHYKRVTSAEKAFHIQALTELEELARKIRAALTE